MGGGCPLLTTSLRMHCRLPAGRFTEPRPPRIGLGLRHHCSSLHALSSDDLTRLAGLTSADAERVWSGCPALADPISEDDIVGNAAFLRSSYRLHSVARLVRRQPTLLTEPRLKEWHQFLTGYGLSEQAVWRTLAYGGGALLANGNTPYNAGAAIVWLKSWGWTDSDIVERVLPCYPHVLAATPEQLQAAVDFLRSRKFDEESVRRMVLIYPPLLAPGASGFSESMFQLIDRIRASAHNKYVVSGSYHV